MPQDAASGMQAVVIGMLNRLKKHARDLITELVIGTPVRHALLRSGSGRAVVFTLHRVASPEHGIGGHDLEALDSCWSGSADSASRFSALTRFWPVARGAARCPRCVQALSWTMSTGTRPSTRYRCCWSTVRPPRYS